MSISANMADERPSYIRLSKAFLDIIITSGGDR